MSSATVSTEWLAQHLGDRNLVVVDATWTAKGTSPSAADMYLERHIPGARRFDIERISDHSATAPHMLPSAAQFADEVGALGIGPDDFVVSYDAGGMASAASRAWWMFRVFGHDRVAVLDGGLPKWLAEGRKVESGTPAAPAHKIFTAHFRPELVRDLPAVKAISETGGALLLDARSQGRFEGTAPEAWAGGRGGRIPGSRSLPYTDLIDPETKALLPHDKLRARLAQAGVVGDAPIVATCGSGVTACVIAVALHELGRTDVPIYDGSWAEWGADPNLPAATGPDRSSTAS